MYSETGVDIQLEVDREYYYKVKRFTIKPGIETPPIEEGKKYPSLRLVYLDVKPQATKIADKWARGYFGIDGVSLREVFDKLALQVGVKPAAS